MPSGKMLDKLGLFEARCNVRGIKRVTEEDVFAFFDEIGCPELSRKFVASYLLDDVQ
jgi:hypothetical protein